MMDKKYLDKEEQENLAQKEKAQNLLEKVLSEVKPIISSKDFSESYNLLRPTELSSVPSYTDYAGDSD
jgi:hypothetical protein